MLQQAEPCDKFVVFTVFKPGQAGVGLQQTTAPARLVVRLCGCVCVRLLLCCDQGLVINETLEEDLSSMKQGRVWSGPWPGLFVLLRVPVIAHATQ